MTPERWREVEAVLAAVLALPEEEQSEYLDGVCVGAPELRREVESLLAGRQQAEGLLERCSTFAGRRIGPYRLVREIGRGGMGAVYEARREDGQFEKTVAIKLLAAPFRTADLDRRFRDERQFLAMLEHPHIARLLDGGVTADGLPFLVMEYVDGKPLTEYCDGAGLSIRQRLELFQKICSAVAFAHQHLIVHRDIKPGNLLITAEGVPKLVDFGIAKMLSRAPEDGVTLTFAGVHPMTPEYASPEQIRGAAMTTASDVYSLGVVLFELLAGRRPFPLSGVTFDEAIRIVCQEGPPKPSATCPEIARELDAIAAKAMAKEAMERYGSPQALADDIGRYLAGLPVSAHRGSRVYQVGKFVRRNRLAVTLSAAALVLITAGVLAIVRQERIAERRFQQVRKLANSVIYELHDGIATLPGSTEVRRLLIARATEYLHALSQEAAGDTALQTELAMAYARVANVQGNPSWANLGDSPAALGTYAKAKSILESVVARDPSKREPRMRLAQVNLDTAAVQVFLRRTDDARASANAGLANWKLLLDRNPNDQEAMSGVAAAYFSLADSSSEAANEDESLADRRRALEIYEALLAAHPGVSGHQRNVALCLKTLGGTLFRRNQVNEARAVYRRALELDRQRVTAHPNDAVAKLDLSFDYGELGVTYDDDPRTALELFSQSLALRRELAAADPRDARVQGRLAFGVLRVGGQHFRLGHYDEALKHFAEGVEISKALLAKSPGDLAAKSTLASGLFDVGDAAIKLGDRRRACDSYRGSLATYTDLASRNPMGPEEQARQDSLRRTMAANCGM